MTRPGCAGDRRRPRAGRGDRPAAARRRVPCRRLRRARRRTDGIRRRPRRRRRRAVQLDVTSEEQWSAAVARDRRAVRWPDHAGQQRRRAAPRVARRRDARRLREQLAGQLPRPVPRNPGGAAHLRAADGAAIVNTCSTGAIRPFPNHAAYGSSKWALRGLTQAAAAELAPSGIRVNAVFPGPIETPMLDDATQAAARGARTVRPDRQADARWPTRWRSWCPSTRRSSPARNSSIDGGQSCRSDDAVAKTLRSGSSAPARAGWRWESSCARPGFRDFTIFDREDGVGGTWRINTYPGLACDVKSHLYSYSFDLNPNWSRLWSGQPEILEYFERCAQRYRLGPNLRLGTEIVSARWDADAASGELTTARRASTRSTSWCRRSACSPSRCCPTWSRRSRSPGRSCTRRAGTTRSIYATSASPCSGRDRLRRNWFPRWPRSPRRLLGAAVADVDPAEA